MPAGTPYLSECCFSPDACPAFTLSPSLGEANVGGWAAPFRDPSFQRAARWPISSAVEKKIRNICSDSAGTLQREGPWKPALCHPPPPCSLGADDGLSGYFCNLMPLSKPASLGSSCHTAWHLGPASALRSREGEQIMKHLLK